jgi:hypothetical protein
LWKVWDSRETIQLLFWRPELKKSLVRTRRRREAENNVDVKNIVWMYLDWIILAHFTD